MEAASRKGIGGPKTAEGKKKVSTNALKHGLFVESKHGLEEVAQIVGRTYEEILDEVRTYYFPRDIVEDTLVRRIARCSWRILMSETMEDRIINRRGFYTSVGPGRERLMRYERLIDIQLHRAIEALEKRRDLMEKITQNKLIHGPIPSVSHAQHDPEFVPPKTAFAGSIKLTGEEPHAD